MVAIWYSKDVIQQLVLRDFMTAIYGAICLSGLERTSNSTGVGLRRLAEAGVEQDQENEDKDKATGDKVCGRRSR